MKTVLAFRDREMRLSVWENIASYASSLDGRWLCMKLALQPIDRLLTVTLGGNAGLPFSRNASHCRDAVDGKDITSVIDNLASDGARLSEEEAKAPDKTLAELGERLSRQQDPRAIASTMGLRGSDC
jgi:hypothetical protein